ncbi:MAG TPA: hypothetical protein VK217_05955 [Acidimicrobiales bacterium]|nr:hypothetical protein [Acidimicrobiales bacterium]
MPTENISISCDDCALNGTSACADCIVTFLLDPPVTDGIVVDVAEARAVRMLQRAGLVPELRFRRRVG